jgi:hypothetical protein
VNVNPWIDRRVISVRPADAQAYMLRHGWKPRAFPRPQILLFQGPLADDGEPIELVVPAQEGTSDYSQCIIELITSLAVLEDREASAVLEEMLQEAGNTPVPLATKRRGPRADSTTARVIESARPLGYSARSLKLMHFLVVTSKETSCPADAKSRFIVLDARSLGGTRQSPSTSNDAQIASKMGPFASNSRSFV